MNGEKTQPGAWDLLAAVMGALFLMSGADGQQQVQAIFLVLAAGCVLAGRFAPVLRAWVTQWLQHHPQARAALHLGTPFWH